MDLFTSDLFLRLKHQVSGENIIENMIVEKINSFLKIAVVSSDFIINTSQHST